MSKSYPTPSTGKIIFFFTCCLTLVESLNDLPALYSLGVMRESYVELPAAVRSALFVRLAELEKNGSVTAQSISNILYGLAKMNAKFAELSDDARQCLLRILENRASSLDDQGLSNSIYR